MIDPDHMPRPVTIAEPRRMPRAAVLLLTASGLLGLLILARLAWTLTEPVQIVSVAASLPTSASAYSGGGIDPAASARLDNLIRGMATVISATPERVPSQLAIVTHTPQPTPKPYVMSTAPPMILCGPWLENGTVCTMAKAPLPTPTPLASCPAAPDDECVWRGERAARVTDDA